MVALTSDELLAWVERTSAGWRALLEAHPEALVWPCDIREGASVTDLIQHIVAVELRYAQRLNGQPQSSYDEIAKDSVAALYATHDRAMVLLRAVADRPDYDWDAILEFQTRSLGTLRAPARTVLVHALMHGIRHYAQLATLVRQRGVKPGWDMDYLLMDVREKQRGDQDGRVKR